MNLFQRLWKCIVDPNFGRNLIPAVVPAPPQSRYYGWVAVSTSMPKTSHDDILLYNGRYPRCGKCLGDKHGNIAFYSPHDEKLKGITYWAYIPTLPSPSVDVIIQSS